MLKLTSNVVIGAMQFKGVADIEIESSWENLTDTCKITIPYKLSFDSKRIVEAINRGDKVSVSIGYDGKNVEVFQGYVKDVADKIPILVTCEDAMFLLKKGNHNKVWKQATTAQVIKEIVGDTVPYKIVANATLGDFKVKNATAAKVLEYLRSNYFIKSWFRGGVLYVGLAYNPALQKEYFFDFNKNILPDHSLEYKLRENVSLSLKGIIMYPNNEKKEITEGDEGGEQRTFHYYNRPVSEVKESLKAHIERLKYTGYYGSFSTLGQYLCQHGDISYLRDKRYPDRDGAYLIKKVTTKFGTSGLRQIVEPESKV
jgi:hypothetical protein